MEILKIFWHKKKHQKQIFKKKTSKVFLKAFRASVLTYFNLFIRFYDMMYPFLISYYCFCFQIYYFVYLIDFIYTIYFRKLTFDHINKQIL